MMMRVRPRILVTRRRYLGDVALTAPVFRNLRLHWPEARIVGLTDAPFAEVLRLNPDVDDVWAHPTRAAAWPGFLLRVRCARFTHVFDLDNRGRSALAARASCAPFRIVLHRNEEPVLHPNVFHHSVHVPRDDYQKRWIPDYYLQTLIAAGVPVKSREVRLVPREAHVAATKVRLGSGRVLLVHPGSRRPERIWPPERFAAVCNLAREKLGASIALAGAAQEQLLLAEIRRCLRHDPIFFETAVSIAHLAALARCSSLVLCHDSGPMHVAAAVGTCVVALHGSQDLWQFHPAGEGHTLLQPSLPCGAACVAPLKCVRGDSYHSFCVRRIEVEEVFEAIRRQFNQAEGDSHPHQFRFQL
jgi:heptosyltransferase III